MMQVTKPSTPQWVVFTVAVCAGLSIFAIGFRLTDEVIVVGIPLLAVAFLGGAVVSTRGWLWGVGMGIGILVSKLTRHRRMCRMHDTLPSMVRRNLSPCPLV